jgi:hypothetical protein
VLLLRRRTAQELLGAQLKIYLLLSAEASERELELKSARNIASGLANLQIARKSFRVLGPKHIRNHKSRSKVLWLQLFLLASAGGKSP